LSGGGNRRSGAPKCLCSKCKLHKEVLGGATAGPGFCCRACNTKRSTLSQIFGHWPIDLFTTLPESNQTAFWQSDVKGKAAIQSQLAKEVTNFRIEEERTSTGGTYLPQSVLESQGFSTDAILACKDTDVHPTLGMTYNMNLKTKTKEGFSQKVWKELFRAAGHGSSSSSKDKKKKKDKKKHSKKKKNRSSGSSTSSSKSSSSSSSEPKPQLLDVAARRKEEALKRKAEQVAAAEAKKAAKAAEAEALKAERAAQKAASEAAKARQKDALASQALYQSLFGSHAQLMADMAPVPCDKHSGEKFLAAQELAAAGEAMIDQALDAMRLKSDLDKAGITGFIKDQKRVSKEMVVLAKKKKR